MKQLIWATGGIDFQSRCPMGIVHREACAALCEGLGHLLYMLTSFMNDILRTPLQVS